MGNNVSAGAIGPGDLPPEVGAGLSPRDRLVVRRCLTVLGVLGSASLVGVAASLYLVNNHPLLLVALSPLGRHIVLVAPIVDPTAFVLIVVVRRMLFFCACFYLGRALGPAGIVWLESRSELAGRFVRWLERLFERASYAVVLAFAGPTTSALAGISGMRTPVYAALATTGLVARAIIVLGVAEWLRGPIEALLALIAEYWVPGTVAMVAGVLLYRHRQRRLLAVARSAREYGGPTL